MTSSSEVGTFKNINLLKEVLECLCTVGVTEKSSKVSLCWKKLIFCSQQLLAKGTEPDPDKLSATGIKLATSPKHQGTSGIP